MKNQFAIWEPIDLPARPTSMPESPPLVPACPTPNKRPFRDEAHARRRLAEILSDPRTIVLPRRTYGCECGAWHLSHRSARTIVRPTPMILAHAAAERRSAAL